MKKASSRYWWIRAKPRIRPLNRNLKHIEAPVSTEKIGDCIKLAADSEHHLLPFVVIVYKCRHGADLDRVRVIGRVLKQTIVRVEELPGDQEEKFSGGPTVVQPATHTSSLNNLWCWWKEQQKYNIVQ